jgi:GH35 family endo-1,4-beta-xylanase
MDSSQMASPIQSQPLNRVLFWDAVLSACATGIFLLLNGLPVGVGNQSLHLAWIRHLRNPDLFANDPLIQSFEHFPSIFFNLLARLIPSGMDPATALQGLQVLNAFFLFLGLVRLTRTLFPSARASAPGVLLFVIATSTRALAETPLPPISFSHTAFGLTLSLFILNCAFRKHLEIAFLLLGVCASVHLLTAAYTGSILGIYLLLSWNERPFRSLLLPVTLCLILSTPVLIHLLTSSATYDAAWLELLTERSAHHVFPQSWWETGDASIGSFILNIGWLIAALAWNPHSIRSAPIRAFLLATLGLMAIGLLAAFVLPHPLLLRAQLFRASMYLRILTLAALTAATVPMWKSSRPFTRLLLIPIATVLLVPGLRALSTWAWIVTLGWTWHGSKLRLHHALIALPVLFTLTLSDLLLETRFWTPALPPNLSLSLNLPAPQTPETDPWLDIQLLTRTHTPTHARILTPYRRSGFRDHSHRSIVGEWRDGTMQFFDPTFASAWNERIQKLDLDPHAQRQADTWVNLGKEFNAQFAVLPSDSVTGLIPVAANETWMLVKTERPPPPPLPDPPENAIDPEDWLNQERFMLEVVKPNIRKNRQSSIELMLTDADGNPLPGLAVDIQQTRLAFGIGSALHHFRPVHQPDKGFKAPQVHPKELEQFARVFNYSVIGFSGKWNFIEPEMGKPTYDDLDAYVDWCTQNNIEIEYHFVTGYAPGWMNKKPEDFQRFALMNHANALISRYGDRISTWQIVNERRLQNFAPDVFALFREKLPDAELGVSHCARFYTDRDGNRGERDLKRGWDSMEHILNRGQTVDYFAVHAHRPFGTWWDPRTMYKVFDDFQEKGIRVHITETGISHAGKIEGGVLSGNWTEQLQADYLTRFLEICYSHPNVDVVNFWGFGPKTWQPHIGLLDKDYNPLPAYHALDTLVNDTWHSQLQTRSSSNGSVSFTGHHGDYSLNVRHPDGRTGTAHFSLSKDSQASQPLYIRWN